MDFKSLQILILAGLLCSSATAQVRLDGSIADANGMGIADVEASLPEFGIKAVSDSNGLFHLEVLSQSTAIRNYAPQSNAISADGNYRVFVPNGARRLLPYSAIGTLRDGVYYLVPGRSYRAEIKITVMGGQVVSSHNIRKPEVAESTSTKGLRKESATTNLVLVRSGVVDTTVRINPTQGSISFKLPPAQGTAGKAPTGTFTDMRDGNTYNTIIIGNQEWFAENLRYDVDGSVCPNGLPPDCAGFGRFYPWVATQYALCPDGWKIPSENDWRKLETSIGLSASQLDTNYWRAKPFGNSLKSASAYWLTGKPTNESGFQTVPAGFWNPLQNKREFFGSGAFFWSTTIVPDTSARARVLFANNDGIFAYHYPQQLGMSVRCLNDSVDANGNLMRPIAPGAGYVVWEKWKHIRGPNLEAINWLSNPTDTGRWTSLQAPSNADDRFGMRVRGYITAPYTGDYRFVHSTNGEALFKLSTDSSSQNLNTLLSGSSGHLNPVPLVRGKRYYFETQWKENWQNEYFSILWKTPIDGPEAEPRTIPGEWLSPAPRSTFKVTPAFCATITPTAPDSAWPAYCREKAGNCGTLIDNRDCREYRWTQIGTQKWMAENLNHGTKIEGSLDMTNDAVVEKYCYNNLDSMCNVYGGLYQWHEAMGLDDSCMTKSCADQVKAEHQGICPQGWTVPDSMIMISLINYVGGSSTAGKRLKASQYWPTHESDSFGFSLLPSGERSTSSNFFLIAQFHSFWLNSNSNGTLEESYNANIKDVSDQLRLRDNSNIYGFSIRCSTELANP